MTNSIFSAGSAVTRRTALKTMAAGAATLIASPYVARGAEGGTIKLGAPFHRTGIGASYAVGVMAISGLMIAAYFALLRTRERRRI